VKQAEQSELFALPLFEHLPVTALAELAEQSFVHSEPAEAVLFQQGDNALFLHVILSGKVALFATASNSRGPARSAQREAIVEIFAAGEVVIAPAVLLELPYLLSARVIDAARIAFLPAPAIRDLLYKNAGFAREAALMLARHWRLLARQLKDQKLRSAPQRLGRYLLTLADGTRSGRVELELPFDRRTLASWLGMSPENLSRSIAQLNEVGVHLRGRRASVDSLDRLHAYCLDDDLR
jgi:CRP/FNR family transcriptional regulator, transcriptional activator FtrB